MVSKVRLVIGALALMSANPVASGPASASSEEQIIPLYASGPRALAMLTIADGPPVPVVFDTGEDKAWLITAFAKRLGGKVIGSGTLTDEATGKHSTVPLLHLASPKISGVAVSPVETMMVDHHEPDMVGVFGPGAFNGRLVTLELSRHRVRVGPLTPEGIPPGPSSPYFHSLPAITIDVAGVPALAHLDSGSTLGLSLGKGLTSKVKLKSAAKIVGQARSVLGLQDVYGGQIDGDVKIGPLTLHDPEVVFGGEGEGANVGFEIMQNLVVVMDPRGQRSWVLDPADLKGAFDQFAGHYGERSVRVAGAKLIYQRDGRPELPLIYLGGDLFKIVETGDEVQFHRANGRVSSFDLITSEGDVVRADRTS